MCALNRPACHRRVSSLSRPIERREGVRRSVNRRTNTTDARDAARRREKGRFRRRRWRRRRNRLLGFITVTTTLPAAPPWPIHLASSPPFPTHFPSCDTELHQCNDNNLVARGKKTCTCRRVGGQSQHAHVTEDRRCARVRQSRGTKTCRSPASQPPACGSSLAAGSGSPRPSSQSSVPH